MQHAAGPVVLVVALAGGIAMASLAGARRTASTFHAYAEHVRLSDVAVNTFIPDLDRVRRIAALPGVTSSATYLGLNGYPLRHGQVVTDFRYTGVFGSYDGRFFRQDRATVVRGRLPRATATGEVALTPRVATFLGVDVGGAVTYRFLDVDNTRELARTTYRVVGIVDLPPVIVDENNIIEGAVLPPAATRARLDAFVYAWQGLRLRDGAAGIGAFLHAFATNPTVNDLPLVTQRYDLAREEAERSVRPQATALALFGAAAAIVALALGAQAVGRMVRQWSPVAPSLRAMGLRGAQLTIAVAGEVAVALGAAALLAVLAAVALSPLAPVGAVRRIAPDTGIHVDATVVLGGAALLVLPLLGFAWFAARHLEIDQREVGAAPGHAPRSAGSTARYPCRWPSGRGRYSRRAGVANGTAARTTFVGGTVAAIAVVAAVVFGTSLSGLVSHPARFGWNWDRMLIAEAGYGSLEPPTVARLVRTEPAIAGWSLLAFGTLTIDGRELPVLAVDRHGASVDPPVVSGRTARAAGEIALGALTLRQLHKHVGDDVAVGSGGDARRLTVVGTVTLPSIGLGGSDHTSLGRGALVTYDQLVSLVSPHDRCGRSEEGTCPNALVFDVAAGADATAVAARIARADPDGLRGGTYEQPVTRSADIRNYEQMRRFPAGLAGLLAAIAAIAFALTLFASVAARARELAVLKSLGLTARQLARHRAHPGARERRRRAPRRRPARDRRRTPVVGPLRAQPRRRRARRGPAGGSRGRHRRTAPPVLPPRAGAGAPRRAGRRRPSAAHRVTAGAPPAQVRRRPRRRSLALMAEADAAPEVASVLPELLAYLSVRPDGDGFVGDAPPWFGDILFGGFVIAQAIMAATRGTPPPRRLHSLHAYFLRPARSTGPITYRVATVRDGRSVTTRRVAASQDGKGVLDLTSSFTTDAEDTDGYVYDTPPARSLPPPTTRPVEPGPGPWVAAYLGPTEPRGDGTRESTHRMWFRIPARLPDDAHLHTALLGFATDWTGVGGRPLHLDGDTRGMVSLDHAAWFHRPARADGWLSYDVHSLVNAGGRGVLQGTMRDEEGRIVVSVAQEMRLTPYERC